MTSGGAPAFQDVMWSDDLLDERERVIVRERHRSPDAAAAITATIRQLVNALDRAGVNEFASLVRSHLT
jgi:hypothetical protein